MATIDRAWLRSRYSDWLRLDGLGSVAFIANGHGWTWFERSLYSDWLQVEGPWSVVGIAITYGWTGWGA